MNYTTVRSYSDVAMKGVPNVFYCLVPENGVEPASSGKSASLENKVGQ